MQREKSPTVPKSTVIVLRVVTSSSPQENEYLVFPIHIPAWLPGTRHLESGIKRGLAWRRSTLLHQRGSALADFLELHFKATKLLRA